MKCEICGTTTAKRYNKEYKICDKCYNWIRRTMIKEKGFFLAENIPDYISRLKRRRAKIWRIKKCVICGKEFMPKIYNQKTCSPECSAELTALDQKRWYERYKKSLKRTK